MNDIFGRFSLQHLDQPETQVVLLMSLAFLVTLCAKLPLIIGTIRRQIFPHPLSFLMFGFQGCWQFAFAVIMSSWAACVNTSFTVICAFFCFGWAIAHGDHKNAAILSKRDFIPFIFSCCNFALYLFFRLSGIHPFGVDDWHLLAFTVTLDTLGSVSLAIPIGRKVYVLPWSESMLNWVFTDLSLYISLFTLIPLSHLPGSTTEISYVTVLPLIGWPIIDFCLYWMVFYRRSKIPNPNKGLPAGEQILSKPAGREVRHLEHSTKDLMMHMDIASIIERFGEEAINYDVIEKKLHQEKLDGKPQILGSV